MFATTLSHGLQRDGRPASRPQGGRAVSRAVSSTSTLSCFHSLTSVDEACPCQWTSAGAASVYPLLSPHLRPDRAHFSILCREAEYIAVSPDQHPSCSPSHFPSPPSSLLSQPESNPLQLPSGPQCHSAKLMSSPPSRLAPLVLWGGSGNPPHRAPGRLTTVLLKRCGEGTCQCVVVQQEGSALL